MPQHDEERHGHDQVEDRRGHVEHSPPVTPPVLVTELCGILGDAA